MRKWPWPPAGALIATALLGSIALSSATHAAVTENEARQAIEQQFGVRVLKIQKGEIDGTPVFLLTVMSPGGNSNSAFQVNRLAVDIRTGKLVSGFRHRASGYEKAQGAASYDTERQPETVLRQGWDWR